MYLQPVADKQEVHRLLESLPVTEENVDDMIDISVGQQVAPAWGFRLILDQFGTCNAITAYESHLSHGSLAERRETAAMLVVHLHQELSENVRRHLAEQGVEVAPDTSLGDWVDQYEGLFDGGSHHIDTTHLASVVRIARIVEDSETLKLAIDLCRYGERLDEDFQIGDESPFENLYTDTRIFIGAMVGVDVASAVALFERKARESDPQQQGTAAIEWYIYLLDQAGMSQRAFEECVELLEGQSSTLGIAPTLFELCHRTGNFEQAAKHFRQNEDLLSYSIALLHWRRQADPPT